MTGSRGSSTRGDAPTTGGIITVSVLAVLLVLTACAPGGLATIGIDSSGGGDAEAGAPVDDARIQEVQQGTPASITVLSNRPDLISGGDVLIEVHTGGDAPAEIPIHVDGVPNSVATPSPEGRYVHLVENLPIGDVTIAALLDPTEPEGVATPSVAVRNHPSGGPVFAGPQIQPWKCQKTAIDEQCNEPPEMEYFYKSSLLGIFLSYDPANPPLDVAWTTTQTGEALPFIVRQETGYLDRSQYRIATLFRPGEPWTAAAPQSQWNHKLLVTHGGGCGVAYESTSAPDVVEESLSVLDQLVVPDHPNMDSLGRGFALMSTALNDAGDNCNIATQAESVMMAKERVVEQYGEIRFTIGAGCSGGALAIQQIANTYPGIYDGLVAQCSFPDAGSAATQITDFHLLLEYYADHLATNGLASMWSVEDFSAVLADVSPLNALLSDVGFYDKVTPSAECDGVKGQDSYHPVRNPGGVRCTIQDFSINILGPRPSEAWSDVERSLGTGFADFPIDNVGVQYGLETLQTGVITPQQFLDLNAGVGGMDVDMEVRAERTVASLEVLDRSYRSGAINVGNNLDTVPIIHLVGPNPGFAHDAYRAWSVRARLDREHGHHDNEVIWYGPVPVLGRLEFMADGIAAMDRWLEQIEADAGDAALAAKVVANRPADIVDRCIRTVGGGTELYGDILETRRQFIPADRASEVSYLAPALAGNGLDPELGMIRDAVTGDFCGPGAASPSNGINNWGAPRMVAGQSIQGDDAKCQLRPISTDDDYGPVGFSEDQWADLRRIFPDGVCDFSLPGVGFQPTVPWQIYGTGDDPSPNSTTPIYGGTPLPAAPAAPGWRSFGPAR